jgi:GntR family transcriptional regulator, transcriptional repressor for pyruvate dehydrogenase complex
MAFQLRTVGRTRLHESIVEQIIEGIRSGKLPPGSVLPSERLLAAQLAVSRGSIREAIRVLEHVGVLEVRTGSGTYVTEAGISKAAALRAHAALVGEQSPLDVMIVRRALEPTCAWQAAVQHHPSDVETLSAITREHERVIERGGDPASVDLEFHVSLAAATRNPVLLLSIQQIADLMRQGTWQSFKHRATERGGLAVLFLNEHREILAMVARRDPRAAETAMRSHLDSVEKGLLAEVEDE